MVARHIYATPIYAKATLLCPSCTDIKAARVFRCVCSSDDKSVETMKFSSNVA